LTTGANDPVNQPTAISLRQRSIRLFLQHLFDLADFLLNFACKFLVSAFSRQFRVVGDLSRLLFSFAFHFMKAAFDLISGARFHHVLSFFLSKLSIEMDACGRECGSRGVSAGAQDFGGMEPIFVRRSVRAASSLPELISESCDVSMPE
jgi:hypothetical protein